MQNAILGPVFAYEWITSSRRWQSYALRSLFVLVLLAALFSIWMNTNRGRAGSAVRYLAELGEGFYLAVVGTQLTLVLLAAPAATAGAICLDRARGTLSHMLMTDLSVAEIVLGKLAARLVPVLTMLACTLPVLEILSLLGGVDHVSLLSGSAVAAGVAVLGCSLALTLSLWVGKTHEALLCTYAIWLLWLLGGPMIGYLGSTIGWPWFGLPRRSEPFFMALAPYWWPRTVGLSDYLWFLGVTFSISAVLLGVTMLRLRSVMAREGGVRRSRRPRAPATGFNVWRVLNARITWLSPSLDGNPVIWREWHRSRPSRWMMLVIGVYGGLSLLFSILAILWTGGQAPALVNGFQVSIGLLLLSVTAATSLAEERVRGSLDLLLSTPLSTRQIVVGKWLGAFRVVPLLAILPAAVIWTETFMADTRRWWAGPLLIAFVLTAGAAVTSLGMAMATRTARVGRAVGLTVSIYVLVTVGWVFVAAMIFRGGSQKLTLASPFFWAAMTTMGAGTVRMPPFFEGAFFWIIFYALCAAALHLTTLTSFDRRLGRIDDVATSLCLPSRPFRILTAVYFIGALCFAFFLFLPRPDQTLFLPRPDQTLVPFGTGLIFSLGLLLLVVRAAWPLGGDLAPGAARRAAAANRLTARLLLAKWSLAARLVPGVLLIPLSVAFGARTSFEVEWPPLAVLLLFMLSVSLAALSLGVALFAWLRHGVSAVGLAFVLWGFSNAGWIALGTTGILDPESLAFSAFHPFSAVTSLCLWASGVSVRDPLVIVWALGASLVYAAAAGLLLLVAVMTYVFRARLPREGTPAYALNLPRGTDP